MCSAELADKDKRTHAHTHSCHYEKKKKTLLIQHNQWRDSFTQIWNAFNRRLKIVHFAPRYPAHFKAVVYVVDQQFVWTCQTGSCTGPSTMRVCDYLEKKPLSVNVMLFTAAYSCVLGIKDKMAGRVHTALHKNIFVPGCTNQSKCPLNTQHGYHLTKPQGPLKIKVQRHWLISPPMANVCHLKSTTWRSWRFVVSERRAEEKTGGENSAQLTNLM